MPNQLDGKPIGRVFGAPLTIKGWEVLPLAELFYFGLLYWLLGRGHPGRSRKEKAGLAALATPLVAGVEWCHNLSHAAAARAVGKPMDEFKILFGTPRLQYWELNDASVTPRQHILRASGGPLFNLAMTPVLWLLRRQAPEGSKQRQVINAGWWMNLLVLAAGILPIPGLDGGTPAPAAKADQAEPFPRPDGIARFLPAHDPPCNQPGDLHELANVGATPQGDATSEAQLRYEIKARLDAARLCRADLERAYLRRAGLRGADLRKASLRRANLRQADLCGADLRQAADVATIPVGRNVVVIGGGMTAVDATIILD